MVESLFNLIKVEYINFHYSNSDIVTASYYFSSDSHSELNDVCTTET